MSETAEPRKVSLAKGRKELKEVIEVCDAISERRFNPFFLDVKMGVETLRQYFPFWEEFEDHCLDVHTINRLSEVVRLQNVQLEFQSSALYSDPEFLAKKIERMSEKRLSEVFLQSWHPIVEFEQLTDEAITGALAYWDSLLPIDERWKRLEHGRARTPQEADEETLSGLGIHGKEFGKQIRSLWEELRELYVRQSSPIDYWKFVRGSTYQETVQKAYLVSFLITYGYAKVQSEEDHLLLIPLEHPTEKTSPGSVSFPISIPKEARSP